MREVTFIKQNAETWRAFERQVKDRAADPDHLADLYVRITDDLSYARTFYPESKTTRYLNALAAEVYQAIYKTKREERGRFRTFWTREVPLAMAASRRELLTAFTVFVFSLSIGAFSAAGDATFARLILGDAYVNMTIENIENGDPMAVYKKMNPFDMFLSITFNNVLVSFYAFAGGLVFSLGTVFVLFRNGVMLGVFHYLFHAHQLLGRSLLVVYIHGTLEISAIIIAGCAGLVMGNSFLFPGTYTRGASFARGARRGLKIVVGLVPVFVTAGFLESFITRYDQMPLALSVLIIAGSLAFVVGYFVVYPYRVERRAFASRSVPA